ncbi:glycosyltransferase, group 1 family protein [Teladorsagia circumcincta]|uniref:Alpha-1,3/1,6-mannosyltransferase ALG2 n=1 Tax=Teladorsagia circumcincta TaxID=45464 RepID=A0A2G9UTG7_TELCI|nr:glycosyltransferase, group 1 family protein [Teladorsagia circumcincta]
MHVVIIHPEQWNGGSDRCTVALIRHFVSKGYKVTWLTTMIDEYWKDHKFDGVVAFLSSNGVSLAVKSYFIVIFHSNSSHPRDSFCIASQFSRVMPRIEKSKIRVVYPPCDVDSIVISDLDVEDVVQFIPSPSECQKFELYRQCDSALYTPPNEHFGIVPIEALDQRRPVIVCDSGGPAETVIEDVTGSKIMKPTGELLAEAMMHHIKKQDWPALDCDETYEKQRIRFDRDFSLRGFCAHIDEAVSQLFPDLAAISSRNRRALA